MPPNYRFPSEEVPGVHPAVEGNPLDGCEVKPLHAIEVDGPADRELDVNAHLVTQGWCVQASGTYDGRDLEPRFVLTAVKEPKPQPPKRTGMKVSLGGTLTRVSESLQRDESAAYLAHNTNLLLEHLEQVRREPGRIQEFFDLWVK